MSRKLEKALDLAPMEQLSTEAQMVENDVEFARQNLLELSGKAMSTIEDLIDLARQSQAPRAYEVLNQLIKTASEINTDVVELQKKKKDLLGTTDTGPTTVNNNLYVGSTAELAKFLENKNKDV